MSKTKFQLTFLSLFLFGVLQAQVRVHNANDIRNMRASSAEQEMERLGYDLSSVDKTSTGVYQYWYNSRLRECVQATIYDGRVVNVRTVAGSKCNGSNNSSDGYMNLNAFRGMREADASDRLQREGYRVVETDGRGRGMVDLYWYNERDRECVKMEVDGDYVQSVTRTSTSACQGSSRSYSGDSTSMEYLDGWGAVRAYDELEDRGFRETKSHKDGGKTYRVWYNSRTGECVKTLSQNKKIAEIIPSNRCD